MKKVFIGVLTALMLFAFTACEPQVTTWPTSKNVSYLTIEQVKDFVVGETATDDGFNVIIHYTDDTVSDPIPGVAEVGTASEGKTPVTASIKFSGDENATEAIPTTVEFKTVTGLSVNGYDVNNQDSTKTATVTLSYDGGSKTYSASDISLEIEKWVNGEKKDSPAVNDVVTVYVTGYKFTGATYEDIPEKVALGTYTQQDVTVTLDKITVEQAKDNEVFIISNYADDTDTVADVEYVVTGHYSDGTTKILSSDTLPEAPEDIDANTDYGWTFKIREYTATVKLSQVSNKTMTVIATKGNVTKSGSLQFKVTEDYPTAVTASVALDNEDEAVQARIGAAISPSLFTYKVTGWASGCEYDTEGDKTNDKFTSSAFSADGYVPVGTTDGATFTDFTLTLTAYPECDVTEPTDLTVYDPNASKT